MMASRFKFGRFVFESGVRSCFARVTGPGNGRDPSTGGMVSSRPAASRRTCRESCRAGDDVRPLAATTYNSKKDTWLTVVILGSIGACLGACATLLISGSPTDLIVAGSPIVIGAIFPIWILQATYYVLGDDQLFVRCGPFRWTVAVASIESVKRTRNAMSGPALSLDRVQIG